MQPHIILHPGFHKTGTTSLQKSLQYNRKRLPKRFDMLLRSRLKTLAAPVHCYCETGDILDSDAIRDAADLLARGWPERVTTIMISDENLSGRMPGLAGATRYHATCAILTAMVAGFKHALPHCRVSILFTTRDPAAWLRSAYWQCMRRTRVDLSAEAFADTYRRAADLAGIVADVRAALPDCTVIDLPLEAIAKRRLGPLDALLDLTDIPAGRRARLEARPLAHVAPPAAVQTALIALDRSDLPDSEMIRQKRALLDAIR